jgi:hypothetical protein
MRGDGGNRREEREEWEWEAIGARDPMFEQSPGELARARVCALTCRARARVAASGGERVHVHTHVFTRLCRGVRFQSAVNNLKVMTSL